MSKVKAIIAFAAGLLCTAGLYAAKVPDWVVSGGMAKAYPSGKFFTAVGEGLSKEAAELKAVQGLASVFGQDIKSAAFASQRMEQAQKDGKVSTSVVSALSTNVQRMVNQDDIIGVEIADYFQETASSKWYALAVLDKAKATEMYSAMITRNYQEIEALVAQAAAKGASFDAFAYLDFAVEIAKKNSGYLARLNVINTGAAQAVDKAEFGAVELQKKLKELVLQIPVNVHIDNDSDGRITKAFEAMLSERGFNTSKSASERYTIAGQVQFTASTSANGKTFFSEYMLTATLSDKALAEDLIPLGFNGREGGNSAQNAETRARNKVANRVKEIFTAQLNGYLQSFAY